jgi:hypothetical protein
MKTCKHYRPREAWLPLIILGLLGVGMHEVIAEIRRRNPAAELRAI